MDLHCKFSSHIISILASQIKEKKNNNLSLKVKKKLYPSVYSENRELILFDVTVFNFIVLFRGKLGERYKHVSEEAGV